MSTVVTRWTAKLVARRALLKAAEGRLAAAERGLAWARKAKRPTVDTRERDVAELRRLVAMRKGQVAQAERVLARHRSATKVSQKGAEFIATFEGGQGKDGLFRPYKDVVGVWTIGYGHTAGVGPSSKPLTKAQALALLRTDLDKVYSPPVVKAAKAGGMKLAQHELDALVSFAYNLGPGAVTDTANFTMARAIRRGNRQHIADAFLLYDKAGGRRLEGLTRRRKAEREMFLGH